MTRNYLTRYTTRNLLNQYNITIFKQVQVRICFKLDFLTICPYINLGFDGVVFTCSGTCLHSGTILPLQLDSHLSQVSLAGEWRHRRLWIRSCEVSTTNGRCVVSWSDQILMTMRIIQLNFG